MHPHDQLHRFGAKKRHHFGCLHHVKRHMSSPPLLEDPSYPGRSGGYIARIAGKFMHECATCGRHLLFLPTPAIRGPHIVYAGPEETMVPLFEVPDEFYPAFYRRISGILGVGEGAPSGATSVTYLGAQYTFRTNVTVTPTVGFTIRIVQDAIPKVGA